jgi:ribosomal protein S27AE
MLIPARKALMCLLALGKEDEARDIYGKMSDECKAEEHTQYLMYRLALSSQDTHLGKLVLSPPLASEPNCSQLRLPFNQYCQCPRIIRQRCMHVYYMRNKQVDQRRPQAPCRQCSSSIIMAAHQTYIYRLCCGISTIEDAPCEV